MKSKIIISFILLFVSINLASASYISGDIFIRGDGSARFNIETDSPFQNPDLLFENNKLTGTTEVYTSKSGGLWTFSLDTKNYENVLIDIHLPPSIKSIVSVSGPQHTIDLETKTISIISSSQDTFVVSYKTEEAINYSWIYWLLLIAIVTAIFFVYYKIKKRKLRFENIMPIINEKEQKIIDLLMKKSMRQKEIRKLLEIPKASFTRYILNLEKKKLITREGDGKNKVVKVN